MHSPIRMQNKNDTDPSLDRRPRNRSSVRQDSPEFSIAAPGVVGTRSGHLVADSGAQTHDGPGLSCPLQGKCHSVPLMAKIPNSSRLAMKQVFSRIYTQFIPSVIKLAKIDPAPLLDCGPVRCGQSDVIFPVWAHNHLKLNSKASASSLNMKVDCVSCCQRRPGFPNCRQVHAQQTLMPVASS